MKQKKKSIGSEIRSETKSSWLVFGPIVKTQQVNKERDPLRPVPSLLLSSAFQRKQLHTTKNTVRHKK
jgi:hypothetical protein